MTNSRSSDVQELALLKGTWAELSENERHQCAMTIADQMSLEEAMAFVEALKARPDMQVVLAETGLIDG